jgi:hypothetical protein
MCQVAIYTQSIGGCLYYAKKIPENSYYAKKIPENSTHAFPLSVLIILIMKSLILTLTINNYNNYYSYLLFEACMLTLIRRNLQLRLKKLLSIVQSTVRCGLF